MNEVRKPSGGNGGGLLTADTCARIDHWVAKFPEEGKRSAMIQALMAAQDQNGGRLNDDLITAVADYLGMPHIWALEVASFYTMFDRGPVGRHKVNVCTNISCWLNGAEELVTHIENKLGIKMGEITPDERIMLKVEEECLAACCGAPMMVVDGHYHENLTPEKVDEILDGLE